MSETKYLFGLGNPYDTYSQTRHNVAYDLLKKYATNLNLKFSFDRALRVGITNQIIINNQKCKIVIPHGLYMNELGISFTNLCNYYKIDATKDILVIVDDIYLNLYDIRYKFNSSSGGHNGIKSIIEYHKNDKFNRLKIGIGPYNYNIHGALETYVLSKFSEEELTIIDSKYNTIIESIEYWIENGITKTTNKYN